LFLVFWFRGKLFDCFGEVGRSFGGG
jgi:hypothetical protein